MSSEEKKQWALQVIQDMTEQRGYVVDEASITHQVIEIPRKTHRRKIPGPKSTLEVVFFDPNWQAPEEIDP